MAAMGTTTTTTRAKEEKAISTLNNRLGKETCDKRVLARTPGQKDAGQRSTTATQVCLDSAGRHPCAWLDERAEPARHDLERIPPQDATLASTHLLSEYWHDQNKRATGVFFMLSLVFNVNRLVEHSSMGYSTSLNKGHKRS